MKCQGLILHHKMISFMALFLILSSCSDRIVMYSYHNDAKSCGYIILKNEHEKICDVQVSLSDNDNVEGLKPSLNSYVVWFENLDLKAINIGKLQSTTRTYSYQLYTHINTICLTKPSRIFVTEESDEKVSVPGGKIISTTKKF